MPTLLPILLSLPGLYPLQTPDPPARGLSRVLTSSPRLAGTPGSRPATDWVAETLREAGWRVEFDEREVLLSLPRRLEIRATVAGKVAFERVEAFDPEEVPATDVPRFNAWSASGSVEAEVVDVGRGLLADYDRLRLAEVPVAGRIAIARYGGAYRGVKARLAEERGCTGLLLFNDPDEDGAGRGPVWPEGPWKPAWAAQRGSISELARCPGDPSTPGWASPEPGVEGRRADPTDRLPRIPCLPIGSEEALALIAAGDEARVFLDLDVPRELRTIVSVLGWLEGAEEGFVVAGSHRDAWVRGAQDAGSGTVALLRAAQHVGARTKSGWKPSHGIVLAFWDAEEQGLIGSTEWGEANAELLRERCIAYLNADAAVSGTSFTASGTPGLLRAVQAALRRTPAPQVGSETGAPDLWAQWTAKGTRTPSLALPGSGSDYTVFLHHLGLPVLDLSFGGNEAGGYHTRFDDFELMDRFLDPTWEGHETAGRLVSELLFEFAERGRSSFDHREAAEAMAAMVRTAGAEPWLGTARAERLALAFDRLARAADGASSEAPFLQALEVARGLDGRPWYRNRLWAPGFETGYAAETLPSLRAAALEGDAALERELQAAVDSVEHLAERFHDRGPIPAEAQ